MDVLKKLLQSSILELLDPAKNLGKVLQKECK